MNLCPRCKTNPSSKNHCYCLPCKREYQRQLRAGTLVRKQRKDGLCPRCGQNPRNGSGYCPPCSSEYSKLESRKRVLAAHGLSEEEYERMLAAQDGVCALCGESSSEWLQVDHNHVTGAVRELLCRKCNSGLGMFGDDPNQLMAAALYLLKHEAWKASTTASV